MSSRPASSDSTALRRQVDEAVGGGYDTPFLRLDLLSTTREARCGCRDCVVVVDRRRAEIVSALPAL